MTTIITVVIDEDKMAKRKTGGKVHVGYVVRFDGYCARDCDGGYAYRDPSDGGACCFSNDRSKAWVYDTKRQAKAWVVGYKWGNENCTVVHIVKEAR